MTTHELFILLNYISVLVMFICTAIISTHHESKMQKYALMVCFNLTVCCIGFLFRAEATTASAYILGQKLIYSFVTFGMFLMLLFILEYCKFSISNTIKVFFTALNLFITFVVLTLDYHKLFYKSYWLIENHGHCILEKEYGFMHTVAILLFAFYMASAAIIAIVYSIRNARKNSKYVFRLLVAVALPCISYILPKITGSHNDFQPIAFAAFSVMVLIMIYKNNLYDIENIASRFSIDALDEALVVFDKKYHFKGCNKYAYEVFPALKTTTLDTDIRSEIPLFKDFIDGNAIEYGNGERIFSVKVCPINEKSLSEGLVVKFEDITSQKSFTDSLQEHVVTLTNYSYQDELTGVCNRRCFEEEINKIKEAGSISDIVVGSIDINGLKQTNDNNCHAAGDELIIGTATILEKTFSKSGMVFRTGGDEFYVIITPAPDNMESYAATMESEMISWHGELVHSLSFSYGFAYGRDNKSKTIEDLLVEADKAMYISKSNYYTLSGKDRRQR